MHILRYLPILLLLMTLASHARDYHVDAGAPAGGDGSVTAPFRTIQQAADLMGPGDVCLIAPGVYPESVRPKASGKPGHPILFRPAAPEGGVLITGADPVPVGSWEKRRKGYFRARVEMDLGHENQVFLGRKMLLEARWPNSGDDPLEPVLSLMEEGTTPGRILDGNLPDLDWTGASVWIHAPRYWSDWTTRVSGFHKHQLEIENIAPYPGPKQHVAAPGADYFIYGCKDALDKGNEWFYDEDEGYLYVFRPDGEIPDEPYYVKRRMVAFDLSGRSHVTLEGLEIYASTVKTDRASTRLLMDGLKVMHPYHSSECNSYHRRQADMGMPINGSRCEVRNSEIAYCSGAGISLGGEYNLVFNCYIHDTDYIGAMASNITLKGKGNIISHCTLKRTGRALIDYGNMYKALIQFCDLSQGGLLTSDTGLTYGNIIEGGGSEVRYNWMHDNLDDHWDMGLYYDHGTQNILSHHNVIWGVGHYGFLIDHYSYYHEAYHNTVTSGNNGFRSTWGNQYPPDLYRCRFFNNVFTNYGMTTAGNYEWGHNFQEYDGLVDHKYLQEGSDAVDAGIFIAGINDGFAGDAPDLGAYEVGGTRWEPGHDFENPPDMDTTRSKTLYRNRLENAAFEHEDHIHPWKTRGRVRVQRGGKGQTTPDTARIRMGRASLSLGPGSEVSQRITGLEPGCRYEFTTMLRVDNGERAYAGIRDGKGREFQSSHMENNAPEWHRVLVHFASGPDEREVTVFIRRPGKGPGEVYADDCGLVLIDKIATGN